MYNHEYYVKHATRMNEQSKRYQARLASISFRVKPEIRKRYQVAAKNSGKSLRRFILDAIDEKIERES